MLGRSVFTIVNCTDDPTGASPSWSTLNVPLLGPEQQLQERLSHSEIRGFLPTAHRVTTSASLQSMVALFSAIVAYDTRQRNIATKAALPQYLLVDDHDDVLSRDRLIRALIFMARQVSNCNDVARVASAVDSILRVLPVGNEWSAHAVTIREVFLQLAALAASPDAVASVALLCSSALQRLDSFASPSVVDALVRMAKHATSPSAAQEIANAIVNFSTISAVIVSSGETHRKTLCGTSGVREAITQFLVPQARTATSVTSVANAILHASSGTDLFSTPFVRLALEQLATAACSTSTTSEDGHHVVAAIATIANAMHSIVTKSFRVAATKETYFEASVRDVLVLMAQRVCEQCGSMRVEDEGAVEEDPCQAASRSIARMFTVLTSGLQRPARRATNKLFAAEPVKEALNALLVNVCARRQRSGVRGEEDEEEGRSVTGQLIAEALRSIDHVR